MSIVESVEPRIRDVKVTSDAIVAYLVDGRVLSVPLGVVLAFVGSDGQTTGTFQSSSAMDKECTGRRSMKTSALKECFTACRPIVHKNPRAWAVSKQMAVVLCPTSGRGERIACGAQPLSASPQLVRYETEGRHA